MGLTETLGEVLPRTRMPDSPNPLSSIWSSLMKGDAGGTVSAIAGASGPKFTVETSITPPFTFTPAFNADGTPTNTKPKPLSWLNPLRLLRPKVTVETALGSPFVFRPYGDPDGNYLPHLIGAIGLLAAGGLLVGGLKRVAKYAALGGAALVVAGVVNNRLRVTDSAPSSAPSGGSSPT